MPNLVNLAIVLVIIALAASYFVNGETIAKVKSWLRSLVKRQAAPLQEVQGRDYALRLMEELREWSKSNGEADALRHVNAAGRALYEDEEVVSDGSS